MYCLKILLLSVFLISSSISLPSDIDIFDAAREGNVANITTYVQQGGDVNLHDRRGFTPFILATYHGNDEAAAVLKEAGADACAVDEKGSNAFMGVAFKGYQNTAQWLLDNTSCDVNHRNYAGQTALMMASLFGREEIVKLLLQHGADATIVDYQGNSPQSLAKGQGLTHILDIIRFNLK